MMKFLTLAQGTIYFDKYHTSGYNYAYVEFTPESVEDAIFYAHQEAQAYDIDEHLLIAELCEHTRMYAYYGGPGRAFREGAYLRFVGSNRVLLTQFAGLDV